MGDVGPLRILSLAEFDPANALSEHRAGLRALGVDYRLAVASRSSAHDGEADWILEVADYAALGALVEFAARADVVQVAPAIGQPWSTEGDFVTRDVETFGPLHLAALPGFKVALFHGSVSLGAHGDAYFDHFARRDHALWTCSPRWALRLGLTYAPAWVTRRGRMATFRKDGEPLRLVHAPTDLRPDSVGYSQTRELLEITTELDVCVTVLYRRPHAEVLDVKRKSHAGFSGFARGTFSVNTLESCSLGIVPLFGWDPAMREAIGAYWPTRDSGVRARGVMGDVPWGNGYWPTFSPTTDGLRAVLAELRDSADLTRRWQAAAARFGQLWCADTLAPRLAAQYGALVGR